MAVADERMDAWSAEPASESGDVAGVEMLVANSPSGRNCGIAMR